MFRSQMEFYIPNSLIIFIILLVTVLSLVSVLGYVIACTEHIKYLKIYVFVCVVGSLLALCCTYESVGVSHSFSIKLEKQCYDYMSMVDEKYVNTLGCGGKYYNVTNNDELSCDKDQQRYV